MPKLCNHIVLVTLSAFLILISGICEESNAAAQSLENWSSGNEIMVDAFSNSIMSPAPVTYDAIPTDNVTIESSTSCIDTETSCNKTGTLEAKLVYEEVATPSFSYLHMSLISPSTDFRLDSTKLSYTSEMFIPQDKSGSDFLKGLSSRQIIRDSIDKYLYIPNIQKNNFRQSKNSLASVESILSNRLSQSFSTTNTELNFSDKNFQESTTGFAVTMNKPDNNQKNIQITKKTSVDEVKQPSATQLLSQAQSKNQTKIEDNSGINDILWLESESTSATKEDVNSEIIENEITLSYQRIDNISSDATTKEIDQELPQPVNPFDWDPNSRIDFNKQSPF